MIGINGREIRRSPRTSIECRLPSQRVAAGHALSDKEPVAPSRVDRPGSRALDANQLQTDVPQPGLDGTSGLQRGEKRLHSLQSAVQLLDGCGVRHTNV